MKTIGEYLKAARLQKKLALKNVVGATRIKKEFVEAIEQENWAGLPEYPVVLGFVKNIALYLQLDLEKALALLRRDYPPKTIVINPKPDVARTFVWSPKLTFLTGAGLVLTVMLGYLVFQYASFLRPPKLEVAIPGEEQVIGQRRLKVEGRTDSDATVTVNNQPAVVDGEGNFSAEIEIAESTGEVTVKARSRGGKETALTRKIIPKLE